MLPHFLALPLQSIRRVRSVFQGHMRALPRFMATILELSDADIREPVRPLYGVPFHPLPSPILFAGPARPSKEFYDYISSVKSARDKTHTDMNLNRPRPPIGKRTASFPDYTQGSVISSAKLTVLPEPEIFDGRSRRRMLLRRA